MRFRCRFETESLSCLNLISTTRQSTGPVKESYRFFNYVLFASSLLDWVTMLHDPPFPCTMRDDEIMISLDDDPQSISFLFSS